MGESTHPREGRSSTALRASSPSASCSPSSLWPPAPPAGAARLDSDCNSALPPRDPLLVAASWAARRRKTAGMRCRGGMLWAAAGFAAGSCCWCSGWSRSPARRRPSAANDARYAEYEDCPGASRRRASSARPRRPRRRTRRGRPTAELPGDVAVLAAEPAGAPPHPPGARAAAYYPVGRAASTLPFRRSRRSSCAVDRRIKTSSPPASASAARPPRSVAADGIPMARASVYIRVYVCARVCCPLSELPTTHQERSRLPPRRRRSRLAARPSRVSRNHRLS